MALFNQRYHMVIDYLNQVNNNIAVLEMTNMMITLYNSLVPMNSKIVSDLKDKYLHPFQVVHKYNDLLTK
jgi:hypothetical protein